LTAEFEPTVGRQPADVVNDHLPAPLDAGHLPRRSDPTVVDKSFVVVVPSFANAPWCQANLDSILSQVYGRYRVAYVDDASPDGTADLVTAHVAARGAAHRVSLIRNSTRVGALANIDRVVRALDPGEIVVLVDGDDALAHPGVLRTINAVYQDPDVWLSYGRYRTTPGGQEGFAAPVPAEVIRNNAFRDSPWVTTHLRTFYAGLYQRIAVADLQEGDTFFSMAWDLAIMLPMLEMAGERIRFVPEVLYLYNRANPLNDDKVDPQRQLAIAAAIRRRPRYPRLAALGVVAPPKRVYISPGSWGPLFAQPDSPLVRIQRVLTWLGFTVQQAESLAGLDRPHRIVAFDVPLEELSALTAYPREICDLFLWEGPAVKPHNFDPRYHRLFRRIYTWRDDLVDGRTYLKLYYPVLRPMIDDPVPFAERKLGVLVASAKNSGHPDELYSERRRLVEFFEAHAPEDFDLYGRGWERLGYRTYRGPVVKKVDCLKRYRFCFAYENVAGQPGYVTEKLFDAFHAACVPVYRGAPNVADHVPTSCFVAREEFGSDAELHAFLREMPEEVHAGYLQRIRSFLVSDRVLPYSTEHLIRTFVDLVRS
jgi:hypothetical protein